ncbi:hypothetical protein IMSAGC007_03383 [Lachnospiraceae bacterium]|nr:hypothetical protein IMSAGC007_03383 [Lachnospiraceae bacterium]
MKRFVLITVLALCFGSTVYADDGYLLTVTDNYLDEDGMVYQSDIRYEDRLTAGEEYFFEALELDGMRVVGESSYSGVLETDTLLEFTYESDAPEEYEVTIIDLYYDTDGVSLLKFVPRIREVLPAGTRYDYEAFPHEGYRVEGITRHTGVLTEYTALYFKYVMIGDEPVEAQSSEPEVLEVSVSEPVAPEAIPYAAEPKMGDLDQGIFELLIWIGRWFKCVILG